MHEPADLPDANAESASLLRESTKLFSRDDTSGLAAFILYLEVESSVEARASSQLFDGPGHVLCILEAESEIKLDGLNKLLQRYAPQVVPLVAAQSLRDDC